MKRKILIFLLACSINLACAQGSFRNINKGTWVVESNIRSPRDQVIKFYNSRLELIYQESVDNKKIRYEREKIRKALDKTLEIALKNSEKTEPGTFVSVLRNKVK